MSQVFKARYYPSGSFLTAKLGANPIYIWRSVLKAQSLIVQSVSCRICNGQDVQILNNPWLPWTQDPYIHTSSEALVNQNVTSLMHTGEQIWDIDLINDIFDH